MKILMMSNYFSSHRGGIEAVAGQLYLAFAGEGEEVRWLASDSTPPPPSIERSCARPFHVNNFVEKKTGLPVPIPGPRSIRLILREVKRADVVLIHDCLYVHSIVAFLAAAASRKPVVVVQHIGSIPYRNRLINMLMHCAAALIARPMLSRANQGVFISEAVKDSFGALRYRTSPVVIFNGVDSDLYRPPLDPEERSRTRSGLGLPAARKVVLFVGRFVEKKGMAALRVMAEQRTEWTWVFAGWGPLNPCEWSLANVRVLTDLQHESLAALYRASDVLALPSYGEGFPLVIQEALASGLPVVCGDECLRADAGLGQIVSSAPVYPEAPRRTAAGFLAALDETLRAGPPSTQELRRFAESRYSWPQAAARYLEVFRRLCPEPSTAEGAGISKMAAGCR